MIRDIDNVFATMYEIFQRTWSEGGWVRGGEREREGDEGEDRGVRL